MHVAAEEQGVVLLGKAPGPFLDGRLDRQHVVHRRRQVAQLGQQLGLAVGREFATQLGHHHRQQEQRRQLGGECLGRGHADFRAGPGQEAQLAGADQGGFGHVADRQGVGHALALGVLQRGQRVGGLARLRDGDDQRVFLRNRVAVAVFAGDLHVGRDAGDRFEPVFGDEAGVVAGAAGQDQDAADAPEDGFGFGAEQACLQRAGVLDHFQRVADGTGLLEDFLLHVVVVGAQLDGIGRQLALDHRTLDGLAGLVTDLVAPGRQGDEITFFEIHDVPGDLQQGRGVGGQEVLALAGALAADAQQQRRATAGADDGAGFPAADDGQRVGTMQAGDGRRHGIGQRQAGERQRMHQVGHHLGVGLRVEGVALALEFGAQFFVVLDDAVVDDADVEPLRARDVGVGVAFVDATVGGPTGVGDAGRGIGVRFLGAGFQLGDPADGTDTAHRAVIGQQGDAGRVIATVFELAQPFDQDGDDIALCCGANDSTHRSFSASGMRPARRRDGRCSGDRCPDDAGAAGVRVPIRGQGPSGQPG